MCDDITEAENQLLLDRRRLGLGAAAAALLVGCGASTTPADPEPTRPSTPATKSRKVSIKTPDGEADGFFVMPSSGKHPAVIVWPDIAGLRPAFEGMATRLANAGYAVLAINPYYRSAKGHVLKDFSEWRTEAGRAKIGPMREALTPGAVVRDGAAFVGWLDRQPEVDTSKKIGIQGYCMSGSFAFRVAATAPRIGAFASFHGGGLVTTEPTSPHLLLSKIKSAGLVCIAENDHERDAEALPNLQKAAKAAGVSAEIEVYPANHGWCPTDSPVHDAEQAERAWTRLRALYDKHLRTGA